MATHPLSCLHSVDMPKDYHPFLKPFSENIDPQGVQLLYTTKFEVLLGFYVKRDSDFKVFWENMIGLKKGNQIYEELPGFTGDNLEDSVVSVLREMRTEYILKHDANFERIMKRLLFGGIVSHALVTGFAKADFIAMFSEEFFSNVLDRLQKEGALTFDNLPIHTARTILRNYSLKFFKDRQNFYNSYAEFRKEPKRLFKELLIGWSRIPISFAEEAEMEAFGNLLSHLITQELNLEFNESDRNEFIEDLLKQERPSEGENRDHYWLMFVNALRFFSKEHDRKSVRQGINYLLKAVQAEELLMKISDEYGQFIANLYRERPLYLMHTPNKKRITYFVHTVMFLADELNMEEGYLSDSDLQDLFSEILVRHLVKSKPVYFSNLSVVKKGLMDYDSFLLKYNILFGEMVSSFAHFAVWYGKSDLKINVEDFGSAWNKYVDFQNGMCWDIELTPYTPATPELALQTYTYFEPSIKHNYFFYKIIALIEWLKKDQNEYFLFRLTHTPSDTRIHQFSLEYEVRETLQFILKKISKGQGYNYLRFDSMQINPSVGKEYRQWKANRDQIKRTIELFEE